MKFRQRTPRVNDKIFRKRQQACAFLCVLCALCAFAVNNGSFQVHALLQPENNRHQHPAFHGYPSALRRNKFPLTNSGLCRLVEKGAARGLLQLKLRSTASSRNQNAQQYLPFLPAASCQWWISRARIAEIVGGKNRRGIRAFA